MYGMNMNPYGYPMFSNLSSPTPPASNNSNMDWIRVNSMADVQNVTVQPGQKAWIMLASDPIFVLKTADNMGITTTDAYRFEKVQPNETGAPEYVTRAEFEQFVASLTKPQKGNPKTAKEAAE